MFFSLSSLFFLFDFFIFYFETDTRSFFKNIRILFQDLPESTYSDADTVDKLSLHLSTQEHVHKEIRMGLSDGLGVIGYLNEVSGGSSGIIVLFFIFNSVLLVC